MSDDERRITSGGGIVRSGQRSAAGDAPSTPSELIRSFRRRWASGVSVMTLRDRDGFRGITLTAVLPVSIEPPRVAVALTADGAFAALATEGRRCALSVLQGEQVFLSERFAGRAPVPDAAFGGVPFDTDAHDVPILTGATASASGRIVSRESHGDHVLVVIEVDGGSIGVDEDDPLITYEGSYRRLEVE